MKKPKWRSERDPNAALEQNLRWSLHNKEIPWGYIMNRFQLESRHSTMPSWDWMIMRDTKTGKIIMEPGSSRAHYKFRDSVQAYKYISEHRRDLWDPAMQPQPKKTKKGGK